MLSQRLAKAAQQASQGNREAFKQLRDSRDEFAALMNLLLDGGAAGGVSLPATLGAAARPALDALDAEWKKTEKQRGAGDRRGAQPGRARQRGALDQRHQPGAAGARRRDLGALACRAAARRARTPSPRS